MINSTHRNGFHLNGHTVVFHSQRSQLEPHLQHNNSTAVKETSQRRISSTGSKDRTTMSRHNVQHIQHSKQHHKKLLLISFFSSYQTLKLEITLYSIMNDTKESTVQELLFEWSYLSISSPDPKGRTKLSQIQGLTRGPKGIEIL